MRTIIVAVYVGPLPVNVPLWLASCAANPGIDWLLVTDRPISPADLPPNVRNKTATLAGLAETFSRSVGFGVSLETGYKLCDFKPLYYLLVDELERYDIWGFCDLDVVFGQVGAFLESVAAPYQKLLTEGHLMLFRHDPETNLFYRHVTEPSWRDTLSRPPIGGLDEHHGINRVWARSGRPVFADPSRVADIDPSFRQFRLLPQYRNYRVQAFAYEAGRVFREYWHRGRYDRDEFLYIHFQKRKLVDRVAAGEESFFIGPNGFTPRAPGNSDKAMIAAINPWRLPNREEIMRVLRMRARMLLRKDDLYSSIRRHAAVPHAPA